MALRRVTGRVFMMGFMSVTDRLFRARLAFIPLMTITAVAERAMALFMREHGLAMAGDSDVPVPRRDFVDGTIWRAKSM